MEIELRGTTKIGGYEYKIQFTPNLRVDQGWEGCINHRDKVIEIDPCVEGYRRLTVFLHEELHLIEMVYECGLDDATIMRLANGFAEFLTGTLGIEISWSALDQLEPI